MALYAYSGKIFKTSGFHHKLVFCMYPSEMSCIISPQSSCESARARESGTSLNGKGEPARTSSVQIGPGLGLIAKFELYAKTDLDNECD